MRCNLLLNEEIHHFESGEESCSQGELNGYGFGGGKASGRGYLKLGFGEEFVNKYYTTQDGSPNKLGSGEGNGSATGRGGIKGHGFGRGTGYQTDDGKWDKYGNGYNK